MRVRGIAIALATLGIIPSLLRAQQSQLPADALTINAASANVWQNAQGNVVEVKGPLTIELDHTRLSADSAIIWITPSAGGLAGEQRAQIALIGNARLQQEAIVRIDKNLLVSVVVRGSIRLNGQRTSINDSASNLYKSAVALLSGQAPTTSASTNPAASPSSPRWIPTTHAASLPAEPPAGTVTPKRSVEFNTDFDLVKANDDTLTAVVSHDFTIRYLNEKGDLLEFQAQRGVLFTDLKDLKNLSGGEMKRFISDHILSAYFEGDVRVFVTPASAARNELRMQADHVFYVFASDRAVMTDVVFHTVDVKKQIPIFMRANTIRQLSQSEYNADNVVLTTSSFATPSYGIEAQKAYVRVVGTGDPEEGERVSFSLRNAVIQMFGIPVFYFPVAGGTMTSRGGPLRNISIVSDSSYGYGVRTDFGLFETLGTTPPVDLDASYKLDYFTKRGPAGGFDAKYSGGFVTEDTKNPWNFLGDLKSYFVYDHGKDILGGARFEEKPPDEFRGRAVLEHQHFFPDFWQLQIRFGYVSDSNFMNQWFPDEYRNGLPIDESVYLKHQQNSEVFSLLAEWQPNDVVSTAEDVQEQREIQRLPEIAYHRVGDSLLDDNLTFFSDNEAGGLDFVRNNMTLKKQGFYPGGVNYHSVLPGEPSFAYTGDPGGTTWRGDFRQEIDWPINAGPFKFVPYVFGRYTTYSQGVDPTFPEPARKTIPTAIVKSGPQNRVMAGGGAKLTTAFWKVDDAIQSDIFDIHRLRHVIEPEINVFASAQSLDQNRLFIYDENLDAVNDVQAIQLALRQRWQTKRGGPGRWRSVDVFTFNVTGNFFANQPDARFRDPTDFRGLFFNSVPESSLARNSVNADGLWRLSDSTAILGDMSENLDHVKFATGSVGLAVSRDDRWSFFLGNRYIADLNSNITSVQITYDISKRYSVTLADSFDFGQNKSVNYSATLNRKFDRFQMGVRAYYDQTTNQSGFSFSFIPYGLGKNYGSDALQQPPQ